MSVYAGIYTINTAIGKFAFAYFQGDELNYTFEPGTQIEGSLCEVYGFNTITHVNYPIEVNDNVHINARYTVSGFPQGAALIHGSSYLPIAIAIGPSSLNYQYKSGDILCIRKDSNNNYYSGRFHFDGSREGDYYNLGISDPGSSFGYVLCSFLKDRVTSIGASVVDSEFIALIESAEPYRKSTDPFYRGGESGTGGGTGDFDGSSDPIDFPDLPTLSATDTGFITLFNPSSAQLKALASYMWSNSLFDLDTWKKIFADPMDAILGLTIVPVGVPSGGSGPVKVGNISTDVNMTYAATQYVEVDCGSLNVNEYWGAYLDYEPFTKAEIYLPYIGTHAISVDDIMNKNIHVKYHVDILSGACAAFVKCGDSILYTFIGQCASSIPITGSDMTNVINGVISAAVSIGSMVATGGASAPFAAPTLASTAVNNMKPNIEKSGGMSGTGGLLSIQTPYLILTRPRQCLPAYQNEYMGYPSFISEPLGNLSGYTEVEQVHLDGISATEAEVSEIESLLKTGVIL